MGLGGLLSNVWIIAMCNILDRVAPVCPKTVLQIKGKLPISSYRGEVTCLMMRTRQGHHIGHNSISLLHCITHTDQRKTHIGWTLVEFQMESFHHFHKCVTLLILMDDDPYRLLSTKKLTWAHCVQHFVAALSPGKYWFNYYQPFYGNSDRLYFLGLQNHCRWWLHPWN